VGQQHPALLDAVTAAVSAVVIGLLGSALRSARVISLSVAAAAVERKGRDQDRAVGHRELARIWSRESRRAGS